MTFEQTAVSKTHVPGGCCRKIRCMPRAHTTHHPSPHTTHTPRMPRAVCLMGLMDAARTRTRTHASHRHCRACCHMVSFFSFGEPQVMKQFQNRTIKKEYIAIAHGCPADDHGVVDVPIVADHENPGLKYSGLRLDFDHFMTRIWRHTTDADMTCAVSIKCGQLKVRKGCFGPSHKKSEFELQLGAIGRGERKFQLSAVLSAALAGGKPPPRAFKPKKD